MTLRTGRPNRPIFNWRLIMDKFEAIAIAALLIAYSAVGWLETL